MSPFPVFGSHDFTVRLWDVVAAKERAGFRGTNVGPVNAVAFAPDGLTLATGSVQGLLVLWDVSNGQERTVLKGHVGDVSCLAFSPDGKLLASGTGESHLGFDVKLWSTVAGQEGATLQAEGDTVEALAYSGDGKILASTEGEEVVLWNAATGRRCGLLKGHKERVYRLAFSKDGQTLASRDGKQEIKVWDVANRRERSWDEATRRELGHVGGKNEVFSPDGRFLATKKGSEIVLWEAATRQKYATLKGHDGLVMSLAFSTDSRTLASASSGRNEIVPGELKLWDVTTGEERASLRGHRWVISAVAFAPDGRTLASGSWDGAIKLWYTAPYRLEK